MKSINWFDTLISTTHKVFQKLTCDRAKQLYKAIVLFIEILCIAIVLGFAKTLQIAFIAASEAFAVPKPIAPDLRVQTLRKTATANGIPNVGRMKKADLLIVLSNAGVLLC